MEVVNEGEAWRVASRTWIPYRNIKKSKLIVHMGKIIPMKTGHHLFDPALSEESYGVVIRSLHVQYSSDIPPNAPESERKEE